MNRFFSLLLFLALLALPQALFAMETVKSPTVDEGKLELELGSKYQHDRAPARDGERELTAEVGYGFTSRFKAKAELEFKEKLTTGFYYDKFKIQTIFNLLTEKNGAPLDAGLYGDVGIADRTDGTHDYTMGIALRKKLLGVTSHTLNLFVKQDFGDTAVNGANIITRWQSKYALLPTFEPGFEILGDTRKKDAFRDQSLRIGPMAYGKFALGDDTSALGYEVGYLFGATPATADGMLKGKLKYEIRF